MKNDYLHEIFLTVYVYIIYFAQFSNHLYRAAHIKRPVEIMKI